MKRLMIFAAGLMCAIGLSAQEKTREQRLTEHVYYFASDSLRGRKAGSEDAAKAADYIARQYEAAGVRPFFAEGWFDDFEARNEFLGSASFRNVVGVIEGSDPVLKDEYIVLGAHYDHLGVKNNKVYNGADDNASGSAAVIEVARMLAQDRDKLGRSVIVAAFDAEELGLFGSGHLAKRLEEMGVTVRLMMSIDMVGWLSAGKGLTLEGVATMRDGKRLAAAEAEKLSLNLKTKNVERSIFTATDTDGFARRGIPTLAVTTGLKSPYHKPEDDADLIDYPGLDKVTEYIGGLTGTISADPTFRPSGRMAPKHKEASAKGIDFTATAGFSELMVSSRKGGYGTRPEFGWNAGVGMQASFGLLGIMADAIYSQGSGMYPDVENIHGHHLSYKRNELLVPVNLVLQTPRNEIAGAFLGGGMFYSKGFSSEIRGLDDCPQLRPDQWGGQFIIGVRLAHIQISTMYLYQAGSIFSGNEAPAVRRESGVVSVKYIF